MTKDPSSFLTPWANFYVMTGSSTAALIGLMFVVVTLVSGTERARRSHEGTANFSTLLRVAYRIQRMDAYTADLEDWIWHTLLPLLAYGAILAGAITLPTLPVQALFSLAAAVVAMLFIGIHNAWDIVTYLAIDSAEQPPNPSESASSQ